MSPAASATPARPALMVRLSRLLNTRHETLDEWLARHGLGAVADPATGRDRRRLHSLSAEQLHTALQADAA